MATEDIPLLESSGSSYGTDDDRHDGGHPYADAASPGGSTGSKTGLRDSIGGDIPDEDPVGGDVLAPQEPEVHEKLFFKQFGICGPCCILFLAVLSICCLTLGILATIAWQRISSKKCVLVGNDEVVNIGDDILGDELSRWYTNKVCINYNRSVLDNVIVSLEGKDCSDIESSKKNVIKALSHGENGHLRFFWKKDTNFSLELYNTTQQDDVTILISNEEGEDLQCQNKEYVMPNCTNGTIYSLSEIYTANKDGHYSVCIISRDNIPSISYSIDGYVYDHPINESCISDCCEKTKDFLTPHCVLLHTSPTDRERTDEPLLLSIEFKFDNIEIFVIGFWILFVLSALMLVIAIACTIRKVRRKHPR